MRLCCPGLTVERADFWAETRDGWSLHVVRTRRWGGIDETRRPLLIVPGYGMNAFIFGFHPRGTSLEAHFADQGIEVWTANLRGQGRSRRERQAAAGPTLQRYAMDDLGAVVDLVLRETATKADRLDVLGASLGGSITFVHLALARPHRFASVIAVGSPLRWEQVPLVLKIPFASRRVAGALRVTGTRKMAERILPFVKRAPALLGMYMNVAHVDLDAASELVRTVEDPDPAVNRDIAGWMKAGDLVLDGVNVTEALGREQAPLLVVLANRDGIVPEKVASSAARAWGGKDVTTLRIGTEQDWYAHADLFVGNDAPKVVFDPIERWLNERR
jgi:pimeloyl-ACP methyl ester carboxylesterase